MIQHLSVSVSLTEMLTKDNSQVDTIWDGLFPDFVRLLPDDLARLDQVLDAPGVLKKFEQHWGRANLNVGRPSIAMTTYVRLMALKHRHCWGYERLVRRVADSSTFVASAGSRSWPRFPTSPPSANSPAVWAPSWSMT